MVPSDQNPTARAETSASGTSASDARQGSVAVCERSPVLRAGLASLLQPWASRHGLAVKPIALDGGRRRVRGELDSECRLAVIAIRERTAGSKEVLGWMAEAKAHFPKAPLVLFSDRSDARGIERAFRHGISGYVPTTMGPNLALSVLTLVLHGGKYVPPLAFRAFRDLKQPIGDADEDRNRRSESARAQDDATRKVEG